MTEPLHLRNLPTFSGQLSEPLLSKGLSLLSLRFLEFLPLSDFNLTRMHFDEASGPSTTSVTRNLKCSLKKLCIAWQIWKKLNLRCFELALGRKKLQTEFIMIAMILESMWSHLVIWDDPFSNKKATKLKLTVRCDLSESGERTIGETLSSQPELIWLISSSKRAVSESPARDLKDSIWEE